MPYFLCGLCVGCPWLVLPCQPIQHSIIIGEVTPGTMAGLPLMQGTYSRKETEFQAVKLFMALEQETTQSTGIELQANMNLPSG
jgi:hypothetical protein